MPVASSSQTAVRRLVAAWKRAFGPEAPDLLVLAEPGFDLAPLGESGRESAAAGFRAICGPCQGLRLLTVSGHEPWGRHGQMDRQVLPLAAAASWGVRRTVYLGIGHGLRDDLKPGTWTLAADYVNFSGISPLRDHGGVFPLAAVDPVEAFDAELSAEMTNAVALMGTNLRLGVYQFHPGPQYPSPAEVRLAQTAGADLVGFGVVPEALAAAALGVKFIALVVCLGALPGRHRRRLSLAEIEEEARFFSSPAIRMLGNLARHLRWGEEIPGEVLERLLAPQPSSGTNPLGTPVSIVLKKGRAGGDTPAIHLEDF